MSKRYAVSYGDFKVKNFAQDLSEAQAFLKENGGVLFELGDTPQDGIRAQHAESPGNKFEFEVKSDK